MPTEAPIFLFENLPVVLPTEAPIDTPTDAPTEVPFDVSIDAAFDETFGTVGRLTTGLSVRFLIGDQVRICVGPSTVNIGLSVINSRPNCFIGSFVNFVKNSICSLASLSCSYWSRLRKCLSVFNSISRVSFCFFKSSISLIFGSIFFVGAFAMYDALVA